jgi:hypothetical protein
MFNNGNYYQQLLKYSLEVKCPSIIQIDLDLKRTFPEEERVMDEKFQKSLRNVLICYSTRNTTIGYCQGMNFVVSRLLLILGNEEHTFWVFYQIMETFLRLNYYFDLTGIIIETTLIETMLPIYLPELHEFLEKNNFNMTISNFIHKWMVCIFTQTLKVEMVYTFLDFFFLDGNFSLIKNSLFIFASLQEDILKQNSFEDIYSVLTEIDKRITNPRAMIYFLEEKNFYLEEINIINIRKLLSVPITNSLKSGELTSTAKRTWDENRELLKKRNINCDPNWPFCLYEVDHEIPEVLIFKESNRIFYIDDYYYIKSKGYEDEQEDRVEQIGNKVDQKLLIERHRHTCDDQKLVDASTNFSDFKKLVIEQMNNNVEKNKSQELKIYESLLKFSNVDRYIKEIRNLIRDNNKIIKKKEIKAIYDKFKNDKYYPDNYSMFDVV